MNKKYGCCLILKFGWRNTFKMSKKVLMLLSNGFHPDPRVYKEAKTLVKAGYEVNIWCLDREENLSKSETIDGIKIKRFRVGKTISGNMFSMLKALYKFKNSVLKEIKQKKFDIIHCHDLDTGFIGRTIQKKHNTKFIFDCHDLYYTQVHRIDFVGNIAKVFLRKLETKVSNKANKVIVATEGIGGKEEGLKEHLASDGVSKNKITCIWNYPEKTFKKKRIKNKKFTISFIGSIRFLKGFKLIFEALNKLKNKNIRILVTGGGVYLDQLKNLSKKYNLEITFTGAKKFDKIPSIYAQTDLMIALYDVNNTNIKRAIAVKQFESLLFGIPTLVDKETLNEEFVNKYGVGESVKTVSETTKAIQKIQTKYSTYQKNCIETSKNHVWEKQEKKLIKIYNEVLQ